MAAVLMRNTRQAQAPVQPPTREDGSLYPWCMYYSGDDRVAFAETTTDLLDVLITGYADMSEPERVRARIDLALSAQVRTQAVLTVYADENDSAALSDVERAVLEGPRVQQPHGWGTDPILGDVWDSKIPLVLVETGYAPYTSLDRPISGIADVIDPPNIIWLRPQEEEPFLWSLARAGWIKLFPAA